MLVGIDEVNVMAAYHPVVQAYACTTVCISWNNKKCLWIGYLFTLHEKVLLVVPVLHKCECSVTVNITLQGM
jgi:hypothetical protein